MTVVFLVWYVKTQLATAPIWPACKQSNAILLSKAMIDPLLRIVGGHHDYGECPISSGTEFTEISKAACDDMMLL